METKKENGKFTIINKEGVEVEFDTLFTFDNEETKKNYIVYTDNTTDDAGSVRVYASVYDPSGENKSLMDIETQKEWDVISDILSKLESKVKNGEIANNEE